MSDIVIVDTSVLLNVLDIPAFNQNRAEIFAEFDELLDSGASFLLPMAAVFETGDHIADLPDGRRRRRYAKVFRDRIREALEGQAPWVPIRGRTMAHFMQSVPCCILAVIPSVTGAEAERCFPRRGSPTMVGWLSGRKLWS